MKTIRLAFSDLLYFSFYAQIYNMRYIWMGYLIITFLLGLILYVIPSDHPPREFTHWVFWIMIALIPVYPLMIYIGARRTFKTNRLLSEPFAVSADETKITIKSETSDSAIPYEKFYRLRRNKRHLYLYMSHQMAVILPLSQLGELTEVIVNGMATVESRHKSKK